MQGRQEGENGHSYTLEGRESSAQGPAPGPSSAGCHLARAEFVIFRDSVGGQEERTPQITVLVVISIAVPACGVNRAMRRHLFSLQTAQFFLLLKAVFIFSLYI